MIRGGRNKSFHPGRPRENPVRILEGDGGAQPEQMPKTDLTTTSADGI